MTPRISAGRRRRYIAKTSSGSLACPSLALQRRHSSPRTWPVSWSWSWTSRARSRPQIAHRPSCQSRRSPFGGSARELATLDQAAVDPAVAIVERRVAEEHLRRLTDQFEDARAEREAACTTRYQARQRRAAPAGVLTVSSARRASCRSVSAKR